MVPETLKAAVGDGWLPAHLAARNGREEVIKLHKVVSDTPAGAQRQSVCKMTVANRARCREKWSQYQSCNCSVEL